MLSPGGLSTPSAGCHRPCFGHSRYPFFHGFSPPPVASGGRCLRNATSLPGEAFRALSRFLGSPDFTAGPMSAAVRSFFSPTFGGCHLGGEFTPGNLTPALQPSPMLTIAFLTPPRLSFSQMARGRTLAWLIQRHLLPRPCLSERLAAPQRGLKELSTSPYPRRPLGTLSGPPPLAPPGEIRRCIPFPSPPPPAPSPPPRSRGPPPLPARPPGSPPRRPCSLPPRSR